MNSNLIKRTFIITDLHFGLRSNSMEWLELQKDYFYNFFIPLVKKHYKPGDVLFILGDIFDNRQTIQVLVQDVVIKLIEDLCEIFSEVHLLIGNHDIFRKLDNEVTSTSCLKNIKGLTIYKQPKILNICNKRIAMMPWRKDIEQEVETLSTFVSADYLFCHSEVKGINLNKKSKQEVGIELESFKNFKKIYSGHIHYSQKKNNFTFVGNPYQMTRSDMYNKKGVYLIDFENNKEEFFENTYSPQFIKLNIGDIFEITIEELIEKVKNNFVDLYISSEVVTKYNLTSLISILEKYTKKIEPQIFESEENLNQMIDEESDFRDFNVMSIAKRYMDGSSYESTMKDKLTKAIEDLYHQVINNFSDDDEDN